MTSTWQKVAARIAADLDAPVVAGTLRAPWKWERLLVDAAVIGHDASRWRRRLAGKSAELDAQVREAVREDGEDSGRAQALRQVQDQLKSLEAFALPVIEELAAWPRAGTWGEWLDCFRASRAARASRARARVAGARGSATDVGRRSYRPRRGAPGAERPVVDAGVRATVATVRPDLRGDARAGAWPQLPRRLRARPGRADVSAEASRGSAPAGRVAARGRSVAGDPAATDSPPSGSCSRWQAARRPIGCTSRIRGSN